MVGDNLPDPIDSRLRLAIAEAIRHAQTKIQWKSGKATQHLNKRIRLGHLPADSTQKEYEEIIATVLNNKEAEVYIFLYRTTVYPTIVTLIQAKLWLVMIGLDSVMETAFPPDEPQNYLADPAFFYVGRLEELQNE